MTNAITQIKHSLNIKQTDFFIAYGMGYLSRLLVSDLREHVDVSVGIAVDKSELQACEGMRTKIYASLNDIGGHEIFDKVYCNFCQLPPRKQHHETVLTMCHRLCTPGGLALIENMNNKEMIEEFVRKANLQKYWHMNNGYDLLFKKDTADK